MNTTSLPDPADSSIRARIIRYRVHHLQMTSKEASDKYKINVYNWYAWEAKTRSRIPVAHEGFLKLYEDILIYEGNFIKK